MQVISEKCVGCGRCLLYCPVGALSIKDGKAVCDRDKCTECNACYRSPACKKNALRSEELEWPRIVRAALSDVSTVYCGVSGRGTEEMKTNDITGRFKPGEVGFAIELGRPQIGSSFKDLDYVARRMAELGGKFETINPVTNYLDVDTGAVKPELMNERFISGIIEVNFPMEKFEEALEAIIDSANHIDSVFSLCVALKLDQDGSNPLIERLDKMGVKYRENCKINVGLGKPAYKFY